MRTLSQMIERVKVHVRGKENLTWKNSDYEEMLEEAARRMWRAILETPAKVALRSSASFSLESGGVVTCPPDCLRIERIMLLNQHGVHVPIPYMQDDCPAFLPDATCFPNGVSNPGWTDDQPAGKFRVMGIAQGRTIRLDYFQEPIFPFSDNGTFRSPDGSETASYPSIPMLCDSACEHLAAALLTGEELTDAEPIGYHGNQYAALLQSIARSAVAKPSRCYVKRIGRHF